LISTFGNIDLTKSKVVDTGAHYTWFCSNNKDLRKMTVQTIQ